MIYQYKDLQLIEQYIIHWKLEKFDLNTTDDNLFD